MKIRRFAVAVLAFSAMAANAQTNKNHASAVGTWKLDVAHSDFGSGPAPKSVTITILADTPQMLSWRVNYVDDKGKSSTYSWSGAADGSMHPLKVQSGAEDLWLKESAKIDQDGSLHRHGEFKDGSSFESHIVLSNDGNTLTEVDVSKSKEGKEETKTTSVLHRVQGVETSGAKS